MRFFLNILTNTFYGSHRVVFSEWNANKRAPCNPEVTETKQCRKEYSIEEHIIHPMFERDSLSMRHDLAMIKTETEVEFDDYVKPICLPFSNRIQELPIDGELFTVTGWGQTELGIIVQLSCTSNETDLINSQIIILESSVT